MGQVHRTCNDYAIVSDKNIPSKVNSDGEKAECLFLLHARPEEKGACVEKQEQSRANGSLR